MWSNVDFAPSLLYYYFREVFNFLKNLVFYSSSRRTILLLMKRIFEKSVLYWLSELVVGNFPRKIFFEKNLILF